MYISYIRTNVKWTLGKGWFKRKRAGLRCSLQQHKGHVHLEGTGQRVSDTLTSVVGNLLTIGKSRLAWGKCTVLFSKFRHPFRYSKLHHFFPLAIQLSQRWEDFQVTAWSPPRNHLSYRSYCIQWGYPVLFNLNIGLLYKID